MDTIPPGRNDRDLVPRLMSWVNHRADDWPDAVPPIMLTLLTELTQEGRYCVYPDAKRAVLYQQACELIHQLRMRVEPDTPFPWRLPMTVAQWHANCAKHSFAERQARQMPEEAEVRAYESAIYEHVNKALLDRNDELTRLADNERQERLRHLGSLSGWAFDR